MTQQTKFINHLYWPITLDMYTSCTICHLPEFPLINKCSWDKKRFTECLKTKYYIEYENIREVEIQDFYTRYQGDLVNI